MAFTIKETEGIRRFEVQRDGSKPHVVMVRVPLDPDPPSLHCDCKGFQFRGRCAHVEALRASGKLVVTIRDDPPHSIAGEPSGQ